MSKPKIRVSFSGLIRRLLLSWLLAVLTEYFLLPGALRDLAGLEGLAGMSPSRIIGISCGGFILLSILSRFANATRAERWGIVGAFSLLAIASLRSSFTWEFFGACVLVLVILVVYAIWGWNGRPEPIAAPKKARKGWLWITVELSVVFFLFVCAWTVGRVYSFRTPTYDFGIFSQMFYSMAETGLPMTTLERDGLLSHFAVHVSPIYYLMLPFYWLVPTPATLQVIQAAVITSAVIPLWKIGKHHGLSGAQRTLVCALLLLYPAFSGGTSYDLHENCFLTPLILWLFYGIDRRSTAITAISALLTLLVKEDAAVYVAVIALWLTVRTLLRSGKRDSKNLVTGIVLLLISLAYFFGVTEYLARSGDGVMTYRYNNFLYDGSASLVTVIKAVILNPMKAIYECVDPEKLEYLARTMLPLLGLPLLTRRYERYLLLIPYVLVNLMSDYSYQHSIFFQYSFGSGAFLIYLTVVNLKDLDANWQPLLLAGALTVSAVCFGMTIVPTAAKYPIAAIQNYGHYQQIRDTLSRIPEDAPVAASTFYTTFLSRREVLYDVGYASKEHILEARYAVLDADDEETAYLLTSHGYTVFDTVEDVLVIYRKA